MLHFRRSSKEWLDHNALIGWFPEGLSDKEASSFMLVAMLVKDIYPAFELLFHRYSSMLTSNISTLL